MKQESSFIRIERIWAMPNARTFRINPIYDLLCEERNADDVIADPFPFEYKKETYKTQIANAKKARPSALGGLLFGGPAPTRPYPRGRSSRPSGYQDTSGGWLMGSSGGSGWSNAEFGSGLDNMLGAGSSGRQLRGRQKKVKSGFDEMFGVG